MNFVIYNRTNGKIERAGSCPDGMEHLQVFLPTDEIIAGEADINNHYIVGGVLTTRPANPATIDKTEIIANGRDVAVISNLPNPSEVLIIPIGRYTVTDGSIEFSTDTAGDYKITISSFPYLDKEFTVHAN